MTPKPGPLDRLRRSPAWGPGLSLLAGLATALMLHYLLYRAGLPSKPFIYVSF